MLGWIHIDRKLLTWEWFDTPHMVHLWVYLLLSANYEPKRWRGIVVDRGQLVCSFDSISKATGISIQSLRTCMTRLESIGAITRKVTNKYTLVTISKYDEYQTNSDVDQQANQQATNNQSTTTKEIKNNIITTTPRVYAHEEAKNILSEWNSWAEMICMKLHLKADEYQKRVDEFVLDQQCQCKVWESENDVKAHFFNWLKMPERLQKPVQKKPKVSQYELERIAESEERHRQHLIAESKRAEAPVFACSILKQLNE